MKSIDAPGVTIQAAGESLGQRSRHLVLMGYRHCPKLQQCRRAEQGAGGSGKKTESSGIQSIATGP